MNPKPTPLAPRAALLLGAALLSTPAFAQEVAPPPVVTTQSAPAPAPAPAPVTFAPAAPVVQTAPEPAPARPVARAPARPAAVRQRQRPAPVEAQAPAPPPEAAAPAPFVEEPAAQAAPPPEIVSEPAPPPVVETAATPAEPAARPIWPWLLVGALLIAGVAAALLFRRRSATADAYDDDRAEAPVAAPAAAAPKPRREPAPLAAPAMAAPPAAAAALDGEGRPTGAISTDAHASKADADDLAGVSDTRAPVSKRPWLELAMRPVRAGTSADEALVEIELIVGNSGDTSAEDVRISTFMFAGDATQGEMDAMLTGGTPSVPPQTIKPGEGTRVDATLAVHKAALHESFSPVVVADARYRLPDGSEGRTSASFRVGIDEGDHIDPIAFDRPEMYDNVAAELHGKPEHA